MSDPLKLDVQKSFWKKNLKELKSAQLFKLDEILPQTSEVDREEIEYVINREVSEKLKKISNNTNYNLYLLLYSTANILIQGYATNKSCVISSTMFSRPLNKRDNSTDDELFFFSCKYDTNVSFKTYLLLFKESLDECYEHLECPISDYIGDFESEYLEKYHEYIYNVVFHFDQNLNINDIIQKKSDLYISCHFVNNDLITRFNYRKNNFNKAFITELGKYYYNILDQVCQNINISLSEINVLNLGDIIDIQGLFNNTDVDFDQNASLFKFLTKYAIQKPNSVAYQYGNNTITYCELRNRVKKVSNILINNNIQAQSNVGIFMERSIDMIISILAINMIGAVFINITLEDPDIRIDKIIKDSKLDYVITNDNFLKEKNNKNFNEINFNEINFNEINFDSTNDDLPYLANYKPDNIACIIYTSGSTGEPKGVLIENKGMLNHCFIKIKNLKITEDSVIAQNSPSTFVVSIWQFVTSILVGGKTIIYNDEVIGKPHKLLDSIRKDNVTILEVVPSYLSLILENMGKLDFPKLEFIIPTGEEIKPKLVKKWFEKHPDVRLLNAYGSTEMSDDVAHHLINQQDSEKVNIPIGKTAQNMKIFILDDRLNLCPFEKKGEIYVSGIGITKGYLNKEKLTQNAYKMISLYDKMLPIRMYKTGDIGKYGIDGNLYFHGRKDSQFKINGIRVEAGEIEAAFLSIDFIKEAVVLNYADESDITRLIAFIVTTNSSVNTFDIKSYLKECIPSYMIPSHIFNIDKMPITSNGKINKQELIDSINTETKSKEKLSPQTYYEKEIASIWEEILEIENIGLQDTFFDLGGHSMLLIKNNDMIFKRFKIELPMNLFFNNNLKQIAKKIEYELTSKANIT